AAAEDRLTHDRRRADFAVAHHRERLADVLARRLAELPAAHAVEHEVHHPLAVLAGTRLRVGQAVTGDQHATLDEIQLAVLIAWQEVIARRHAARGPRFGGGVVEVEQVERQLGRLAEQRLDALRLLQTRQLDQDAILTLGLDRRLLGAGLVDAAANDLDRLAERLAVELDDLALLKTQGHRPVGLGRDHRCAIEFAQRVAHLLDIALLANLEGDARVAVERQIADGDTAGARNL